MKREQFGICDVVGGANRDKIDASDLGMQNVQLRDMLTILEQHPKVTTLIFTGETVKMVPNILCVKFLKKQT